ncbi:MAG: hypothetical protein Q8P69_01925 [bacterium]|nr:hypothetical protein [bacterium]
MKYFTIIIIWFIVFISDGIILPALTGLPAGFGILVFLLALMITFGVHRWVIGSGIIIAGVTELILGVYFGVIIGTWLVMAWIGHVFFKFLNIESMNENNFFGTIIPFTLFGIVIFAVGEGTLWVISRLAYESGLSPSTLFRIVFSPMVIIIVAIELVVTLFIFRFIYYTSRT